MRRIRKRSPPASFVEWSRSPPTPGRTRDYEELRSHPDVREDLEVALFQEQGGVCAYTGKSLGSPDADRRFHVEHVVPQSEGGAPGSIDYANMVACWPEPNRAREAEFGARKKAGWWEKDEVGSPLFVSPLKEGCERRFQFSRRGRIAARNESDRAACRTIDVLNLNHPRLVAERRRAIQGVLELGASRDKIDRLLRRFKNACEALDTGSRNIRLEEFEFALRDILERMLARIAGRG